MGILTWAFKFPKTGIDATSIRSMVSRIRKLLQLALENYNFGGMTSNEPTGDPKDKQPDGGNYYMHFGNEEEWQNTMHGIVIPHLQVDLKM